MKNLGYILIILGFLFASGVAVQEVGPVNWVWYSPGFVLAVIGVILARKASHQEARSGETLTANIQVVEDSIEKIVNNITAFNEQKKDMNPYDALHRIDELFPEDLSRFVDARQSIAHVFGLSAYADVMNHFAAGERYLNRVWSASVDGYIDEVQEYIGRSREQFMLTQEKLQTLKAS